MTTPVDPTLLAGLRELSASAFPKRCATCGRVYQSAEEYTRLTHRISANTSGLKQSADDDGHPIVELFRNCECGSTLMDAFCDRRNPTPEGVRRRARFGELLDYIVARGIERQRAREELLKVMRGEPSPLLRNLPPPTAS